ncbi:MAG: hypothetical protein H6R07_2994 [Proteobacteria bacterium]|nr:hypothetical protein [Pseudomonadota bacterium]
MSEPKLHSVLSKPHEYELSEFRYHVEKKDPSLSFIDMTLQKNAESVTLRFWQPINLKIEEGFPQPTGGMVFYDLSADGLENIGVKVADFEASWGSVTFSAKIVEKISA